MFKHILVPVGHSKDTGQALEVAGRTALNTGARLSLLHVVELIADTDPEDFEDFYNLLEKRSSDDLKQVAEQLEAQGIAVSTRVVYGQRVRQILDFASENAVDLIILQSHAVDLTDPTRGWGTISYRVAILAHCPVMLVK